MLEKNFRKKVIVKLKEMGAHVVGAEGLGVGTSDLLVCYEGKFVAIELKGSDNKNYDATEAQKLFLKKVRNAGGVAFVLRHSEYWESEMKDYLDENNIYEIK